MGTGVEWRGWVSLLCATSLYSILHNYFYIFDLPHGLWLFKNQPLVQQMSGWNAAIFSRLVGLAQAIHHLLHLASASSRRMKRGAVNDASGTHGILFVLHPPISSGWHKWPAPSVRQIEIKEKLQPSSTVPGKVLECTHLEQVPAPSSRFWNYQVNTVYKKNGFSPEVLAKFVLVSFSLKGLRMALISRTATVNRKYCMKYSLST